VTYPPRVNRRQELCESIVALLDDSIDQLDVLAKGSGPVAGSFIARIWRLNEEAKEIAGALMAEEGHRLVRPDAAERGERALTRATERIAARTHLDASASA
jgi:hypothetical protein